VNTTTYLWIRLEYNSEHTTSSMEKYWVEERERERESEREREREGESEKDCKRARETRKERV
jgi:hypothetical protein